MKKWLMTAWVCMVLPISAAELSGDLTQGSLLRGKAIPGSRITLNGQPLRVTSNGEFVAGFGRDAKLTHQLKTITPEGDEQIQTITLGKRDYNIQRIEGIARKMMQPDAKSIARAKKDAIMVRKARQTDSNQTGFLSDFIWPLKGRISGVYGSQRFYNGEPRRPHFGIDIAAPMGTGVLAPADGIITLWVPDMFYSGGTLIIDHGYGISSTFLHLSGVLVAVGDKVKQGQKVAKVGSTGRSTGPHLDWRINWFNVRMDPASVVGEME